MTKKELINSDIKEGSHLYGLVIDKNLDNLVVGYTELQLTNEDRRYKKDKNGNFYCISLYCYLHCVVNLPDNLKCISDGYRTFDGKNDYELNVYINEKDAINAINKRKSEYKKRKITKTDYENTILGYKNSINYHENQILYYQNKIKLLDEEQEKFRKCIDRKIEVYTLNNNT